jgi:hypothetical protein
VAPHAARSLRVAAEIALQRVGGHSVTGPSHRVADKLEGAGPAVAGLPSFAP